MTVAAARVVEFDARRPPTAADLAGQRRFVLAVLSASGVPARDRPDVAQDVLVDAWLAIVGRRYRHSDRPDALRRYLRGIAWRHAWDYRERAHVRLEHLSPNPLHEWRQDVDLSPSPLEVLVAHEAERCLGDVIARLPRPNRDAVRAIAEHDSLTGCAAALGVPITTAFNRLHAAAERVRAALRRVDVRDQRAPRRG